MADGFTVDRAALRETAQEIDRTIGAFEGLAFDEEANIGRGFSGLALPVVQAPDARIHLTGVAWEATRTLGEPS